MGIIYIILAMLLVHMIADFLLQSKNMAMGKSSNLWWLLTHAFVYSASFFIIGVFFFPINKVLWFTLVTFIFHGITDLLSSRWIKKQYQRKKFYGLTGMMTTIGYDQFAHYVQLLVTYQILFGE